MRLRSSDYEDDDIMALSDVLDNDDFLSSTELLENDMTAVKKATAADKAAPKTKTKAVASAPAKKTKAAKPAAEGKEKGVFGPRVVPEGHTGLNTLAEELGIKPAAARRKLRGVEGLTKPEGQHGWYWKDGSKDLASIRKALTPAAE